MYTHGDVPGWCAEQQQRPSKPGVEREFGTQESIAVPPGTKCGMYNMWHHTEPSRFVALCLMSVQVYDAKEAEARVQVYLCFCRLSIAHLHPMDYC